MTLTINSTDYKETEEFIPLIYPTPSEEEVEETEEDDDVIIIDANVVILEE